MSGARGSRTTRGAVRRPLRTTFLGLEGFWPETLAGGLGQRYPDEFSCRTLVQGAGIASVPHFVAVLRGSDLVVRVGATFRWNSTLDRMLLALPRCPFGAPVVIYWTGTDVLMLQRSVRDGTLPDKARAALAGVHHIAGAEHLAAELAECGVDAQTVPFPAMALTPPPAAPPMPERFRVLTYLPAGSGPRFHFYGGPQILKAARALPDVEFAVMGAGVIDTAGLAEGGLPGNVSLLGRVDDPASEYARSSTVVRMVEHDAVGGTVCEGLMYGRHVIYTYDVPHTVRVAFGDVSALVEAIGSLHERHRAGSLELNRAGFDYAAVEFDPDARFARLRDVLDGIVAVSAPPRSSPR